MTLFNLRRIPLIGLIAVPIAIGYALYSLHRTKRKSKKKKSDLNTLDLFI